MTFLVTVVFPWVFSWVLPRVFSGFSSSKRVSLFPNKRNHKDGAFSLLCSHWSWAQGLAICQKYSTRTLLPSWCVSLYFGLASHRFPSSARTSDRPKQIFSPKDRIQKQGHFKNWISSETECLGVMVFSEILKYLQKLGYSCQIWLILEKWHIFPSQEHISYKFFGIN